MFPGQRSPGKRVALLCNRSWVVAATRLEPASSASESLRTLMWTSRPAGRSPPTGRVTLSLPHAEQLDVDLGEQQRIDKGAVLGALGIIDP